MTEQSKIKLKELIELRNQEILNSIISNDYPTNTKFKDITGKNIKLLHVDYYIGQGIDDQLYYQCTCQCGNTPIISRAKLCNHKIKSCGCTRIEACSINGGKANKSPINGDSSSRLYNIWKNIKQRTTNPKVPNYNMYGGRGITICDEWKSAPYGYLTFKEWSLNNGYDDSKSIDRIDNDKGYSPDNCRWITHEEQQWNRMNNHFIQWEKYVFPMSIWSKITGIKEITICSRMMHGFSIKDILFRKPSYKKNPDEIEYITFNPYIADEFSEYNKYDEFVRKGIIDPINDDPNKYISISNINFNKKI